MGTSQPERITRAAFESRLGALALSGPLVWPVPKRRNREILLHAIWLAALPPGEYSESEINDAIARFIGASSLFDYMDHVTLRRELVDAGYLARDARGSRYAVAEHGPPEFADETRLVDPVAVVAAAREDAAHRKQKHLARNRSAAG